MEQTETPASYAAFFKTQADSQFATNALRFATKAEAECHGRDLFSRWFGASAWEVRETTDTPNYRWDAADGLVRIEPKGGEA